MQNSLFQNQYVRGLVVLALIGVVSALTAYTYFTLKQAGGIYSGNTTISVSGEGEVVAKPDIGTFTFTVQSEGVDAKVAQAANAAVMGPVMAYLKEKGVEEKDIKTDAISLNPKYRYEERPCLYNSYCPQGDPIEDGFEVYQNVTVTVRNIDASGEVIGGLGELGISNLSGLQFMIDDTSIFKDEARTAAIEDAKQKAQGIADSLDMKLGKMVGFYEEGNEPMYYGGDMRMESAEAMDGKAMNAVLPTGENKVMSTVSLTFELE
jgi:uncharacterized protein YggE